MIDYFYNLSPNIQALIAGIFTWLMTTIGASLVLFFKKVNNTILNLTLGFSAGIMLAASIFSLIEPAIKIANTMKMNSIITISLGLILGALFIIFSEHLYIILNNKKNIKVDSKKKRCMLLVSSITLHNIPEGLVLGVSFGSLLYNIPGASIISSLTLALGIGIQNFPEGCAISLPLRSEGYSIKKSFFYGSISAIVEPISAVLGAILVMKVKVLLPTLLSLAAGAMMFVIINELIPESQNSNKKNIMTLITILGFVFMMILDIALG